MPMNIQRVWSHLEFLAAESRFAETARLEVCRQYCEQALHTAGQDVVRDTFSAVGSDGITRQGTNLIARHSGVPRQDSPRPVLIVGAHVDTKPHTPGADDNATAVAVLLELANQLEASELSAAPVDLELVVFDLEELGMLGGARHAERCRRARRRLVGMVSLEMLGYCDSAPGSQQIPPALAGRYPDTGDFIAIVGNQNSGRLLAEWQQAMRSVGNLKVEALQVPEDGRPLPPVRLSDHSPFWDAGYPALMVTDTSFMRNPNYHEPTDTPDTIDRAFLHRVADGTLAAVRSSLRIPA